MAGSMRDDEHSQNEESWEAEDLHLEEEPVHTRATKKANLLIRNGAAFEASAVAVGIIGKTAHKNDLGTSRPSEVLFGVVKGRKQLAGIPVPPDTPGATNITYRGSRAYGTLYPIFARLDRLVQPGRKERYFVKEAPAKVKIKDVTGWGFYIDLVHFDTEPIQKLSDEDLAKRRATLAAKKAAKKAAKEAAAKKAEEDSAPTTMAAEQPEDVE